MEVAEGGPRTCSWSRARASWSSQSCSQQGRVSVEPAGSAMGWATSPMSAGTAGSSSASSVRMTLTPSSALGEVQVAVLERPRMLNTRQCSMQSQRPQAQPLHRVGVSVAGSGTAIAATPPTTSPHTAVMGGPGAASAGDAAAVAATADTAPVVIVPGRGLTTDPTGDDLDPPPRSTAAGGSGRSGDDPGLGLRPSGMLHLPLPLHHLPLLFNVDRNSVSFFFDSVVSF